MITLEELNVIKEKRKTNLYYEEKEYLQYIFLNALSHHAEDFIFKGGTCLRLCFGLERASEDLDFSTNLSINEIKEVVRSSLKDFSLLNINYKIYAEKEYQGNLRMEMRFEGPLFLGQLSSTNTLKIDFNHGKVYYKKAAVISKLFSDIPIFTLLVMEEKEILAEKIRTLINRAEPRDLYDLWMLLKKGGKIDKNFLSLKLKEEGSEISALRFPSKEEYERDLKNLLSYLPSYEQVKKEVEEKLKFILT